jgi:hypothetical protein
MIANPVLRRALGTIAAVAIAIAGVVGLIAFLNAHDDSTTGAKRTQPALVNSADLLRNGNIELAYADPAYRRPLAALAKRLGAPDTPELRAAGAAIVLRRDATAAGVVARAYGATFNARSPADPRLQEFVDRWLGQGTQG